MSLPLVPFRFADVSNLDAEEVNANLLAIQRDADRDLDHRYTRSSLRFDLTGMTSADALVLRQFFVRRPGASNAVEVESVELTIYTSVAVAWTLSCSDASWPDLVLDTAADVSVESYTTSGNAIPIPSSAADVTFTLAASAASTITSGEMIVHLRCDRGNQGDAYTRYTPSPVYSAIPTAETTLNTELAAAATSVAASVAADKDVRCECFTARNIAASTVAWQLPSGARRVMRVEVYLVQAAGSSVDVNVTGGITAIAVHVAGAGVATLAVGGANPGADAVQDDDPLTAASDIVVSVVNNGAANALLVYALVWWS